VGLELALTPDGRWDISTEALIDATATAGFGALGIAAPRAVAGTREQLAAAGLRCHELLALQLADDMDSVTSQAEQLAEAAALVEAEFVLTVFQDGLSDSSAKVIRRAAEIFAEAGTKMAVEFSPLGPVATIDDGLAVVAAAGAERAGLLIDSWHFCVGESTWAQLEQVPIELIAYLQFDDALERGEGSMGSETMNRRAMPGDGVLELDRFATTLLERGFDGTVSIEVLNRELRELPVEEFARRAVAAAAPYWGLA
jgi:sugar phosphate isomerase/epimerase